MRQAIIILILLSSIVLAGCGSLDAVSILKANQQVKEFLKEYPNADITIIKLKSTDIADANIKAKELCGITLEEKAHYLITVNDLDSNLDIYAYIDAETNDVVCIKKIGKEIRKEIKQEIQTKTENTPAPPIVVQEKQSEQPKPQQTENKEEKTDKIEVKNNCISNPSGFMPNPNNYPDYYNSNSKIHTAIVLHRTVKDCNTNQTLKRSKESLETKELPTGFKIDPEYEIQQVELLNFKDGYYCNYLCRPRYNEQCILDGSFDSWYDEWCEFEDGTNSKDQKQEETQTTTPTPTIIAPTITRYEIKKPKVLHRIIKYCDTNKSVEIPRNHTDTRVGITLNYETSEQIVQLPIFLGGTYGNYICKPRYNEQCIWDGSFDTWYDEWCEYEDEQIQQPTPTTPQETTQETLEQCIMPSGIACLDFSYDQEKINIIIQNAAGFDMSEVHIVMPGCGTETSQKIELKNGEKQTISLQCKPTTEMFETTIDMTYTNTLTGLIHTKTGKLKIKTKQQTQTNTTI